MNEPIIRRRRRRRTGDEDDISLNLTPETSSLPTDNVEPDSDNAPQDQLEVTTPASSAELATIDRIRTELLEDDYHHELTEPHFSDDTHNWSEDSEFVSSDYWHFLGRYE